MTLGAMLCSYRRSFPIWIVAVGRLGGFSITPESRGGRKVGWSDGETEVDKDGQSFSFRF